MTKKRSQASKDYSSCEIKIERKARLESKIWCIRVYPNPKKHKPSSLLNQRDAATGENAARERERERDVRKVCVYLSPTSRFPKKPGREGTTVRKESEPAPSVASFTLLVDRFKL